MKAVILAGGKGTRLYPYTATLPKPLVPVGDRPILEIVLEQLGKAGYDEAILAVGHLAGLIQAYFGEERCGVKLKYAVEDEPLGTAGPLANMKTDLDSTFLLMNGDVLTTLDYQNMLDFHKAQAADATIGLVSRQVNVDFGVVEVDGTRLTGWSEKPKLDYLVSTGIYLFEPQTLKYLEPGKRFDLPDFVQYLIKGGKHVAAYKHDGYWLDIGRPQDYEEACRLRGDLSGVDHGAEG